MVTAEGRTLFCNQKASRLLGHSEEQICSLSIVNYLPDWFTLPAVGSTLESIAVDGHGETFTVELSLAPVQTPSGPMLVGLIRDARRRNAELAGLAEEEASLREQIQKLSLRERDLKSEMEQAASILESHLPPKNFNIPGIQVSWRFSPCYTLGGDMVKLFPVSKDLLGFCILDVSGHGIPASLLAISLARSLSTDRARGGILEGAQGNLRGPKDILSRLNEQYQILHQGEQFVTMLYGILDKSLRKVHYVSAGHPHPLRLSRGDIFPLQGPINPPVGVLQSVEYEETVVQLSKGDSLFFYTDGVTEARNPGGEMFDDTRLLECLRKNLHRCPEEILEALYDELARFRFGREQTDDVTSLILKI